MKKLASRGRPISVFKDVEVEVDVYLDEFETDELLEELKRRKGYIDYKSLYEELGWYIAKLRETKCAGDGAEAAINQLLLTYHGDYR